MASAGWRVPVAVVWLFAACGAVLIWIALSRRSSSAGVGVLVCAVSVGVYVVAIEHSDHARLQGEALISAGSTEAWITVTGQPAPHQGWDGQQRYRFAATVTAQRPHCREPPDCELWSALSAPAVISLTEQPRRGEQLLVDARWSPSQFAPATVTAWDARIVAVAPPSVLVQWRERFFQATAGVSESPRGLVRGMIVGDTSSMTASQVQEMRVSGLAHLTAVSGAHFAILIMASGAVMAAVRAPRLLRAVGILAVAVTFAALVGAESSVVRALGMATATALAAAWGRPARGFAALTVTVTVLLMLDPSLASSLGFAMSVAAVAAIVLWSPRIAALLAHAVTPGLARIAAIPIAAQAAITPLLIVIEPHLGTYAVIANLAAGIVILPTMVAGAATLLVAAVSVEAAQLVAHVAGACAGAIGVIARAVAGAPAAWLPWPQGAVGVGAALLMTALLMVVTAPVHTARRVAALVLAAAVCGAGLSVTGTSAETPMGHWDIAACDVGQGDMLLVRTDNRAAVVIDTGPPGGGAAACLNRHGITHVPLLVLTHPHQDHDGAVLSVVETATVESAWVSAEGLSKPAAAVLSYTGVPVKVPEPGTVVRTGRAVVTVLSEAHTDPHVGTNDASVIVHAATGDTAVIALGDLEQQGQTELLRVMPPDLHADVVKVAHHGSADQLPQLADRLAAPIVVVSAGADNRHGHPTSSALDLYGAYARAVLRTDECGDVHVGTVDSALTWSHCPTDVAR